MFITLQGAQKSRSKCKCQAIYNIPTRAHIALTCAVGNSYLS